MNNNRNNNRRRGRGNRNQGGGGQQGNRIDSRARGNAPQLLEKYRKLAEDAHRNGDRVQAEYYLQFADHYFRVIADNKARQDEQRGPRQRDERDYEDEGGEDDAFEPRRYESRDNRERRPRDRREEREERPEGVQASEGDAAYEPAENPFVRKDRDDDRGEPRQRRPRSRRNGTDAANSNGGAEIDVAVLPPSIGAREEAPAEDAPAPRRRRRKAEDGEAVSAAG